MTDILESVPLEYHHKVCELYEDGYSYGKVCRMLGPVPRSNGRLQPISERAVKTILEHYNIPIRRFSYTGRGNKFAKTSLEQFQDLD